VKRLLNPTARFGKNKLIAVNNNNRIYYIMSRMASNDEGVLAICDT